MREEEGADGPCIVGDPPVNRMNDKHTQLKTLRSHNFIGGR